MEVKEITVAYGRTLNLGNYESMRIELAETVTLDDKDDPAEVRETVFNELKEDLSSRVRVVREKLKK